jgi:zinc protease
MRPQTLSVLSTLRLNLFDPLRRPWWSVPRSLLAFLVLALSLPPGAWADAQQDQKAGVLRATLENGLRVVIVRNTLAPVTSVVVNYLAGSDEAPAGFPGMAHAQEHMMFRGSPGLSGDQLAYIDAALGGMSNADTQQSVTQYLNTVPAKDLGVALHIEAIRMRGVSDDEAAWVKERGAIEQEVSRDLSDPEYVLYTKLLKALFHGSPYAHDALGTRASFDKTTGGMLKAYYDRWYAPNNAILVIVGDVQPQAVLAQVKRLFGDIPRKQLPQRPAIHPGPVQTQTIEGKTDRANGMVVAAFRLPGYDSPDYAALNLLSDVMSSQRGSLYALAADGKALGTGAEADFLPHAGLAYVVAEFPKGGDSAALMRQVKQVIRDYAKDGFPDGLVAAAKRRELMALELQKNSIAKLAAAWSEALAVEGRQSPQDDVEAMQKVSAADVARVARKYLNLDQAVFAVLTPEDSGKPVSGKGFGGTESFAPEHPGRVEAPAWARAALEAVAVPKSTIHPVDETLPNGLRLIVQPTSTSDTVSVYGRVRSESLLEAPPGKDGVDQVLDRLFNYGTATQDRLAYQQALDAIGADESAGTSFSVVVLRSHLERALQLLADNELHPAFREKDFAIVRRQVAAQVAGELESPGYLTRRALLRAIYPKGDPKLRQATPKTVMGLGISDAQSYYQRVFRPDMTTIVALGKVDPAQVRALVVKYFGDWKAEGPKPDVDLPRVPRNPPSTTAVPDRSRMQDKVILAETLGMDRFNPDYYPLELGNHVLGGGFYATRLYRDLRERNGLVYSVGASLSTSRTRAVYVVEYACDPKNVSLARAIVEKDLGAMQTEAVGESELKQAKALLMTETALGESSVTAIAGGLLDRATIGLPLDEPTLAAHKYLGLNAEQVKDAFARRLRLKDLAQVTQGPTPQ